MIDPIVGALVVAETIPKIKDTTRVRIELPKPGDDTPIDSLTAKDEDQVDRVVLVI